MSVLSVLFGNYSKRELKRIQPICDAVLKLEDKYKAMSDSELQAQTSLLKERLSNGETRMTISRRFCGMPEASLTGCWACATSV